MHVLGRLVCAFFTLFRQTVFFRPVFIELTVLFPFSALATKLLPHTVDSAMTFLISEITSFLRLITFASARIQAFLAAIT